MEKQKAFGILGTSIGHGQPKPGVEKAYEYLELLGFWKELKQEFPDNKYLGSLPNDPANKAYTEVFHKTLSLINKGLRPGLIGGDHSQAFATISAIHNKNPNLRILWFDAHADMNTPLTSPSGNIHGMPLSGLLGLVDKNIWGMPWLNQLLKPEQVIHIGVRDIDRGERELMEKHKIEHYTPEKVRELGIDNIMKDIAKRWKNYPTHLSFDIDGLDSSLVPATGTPVSQGMNMDEAYTIIDSIKRDFNFVSFEVVEFNPDLAKNKQELETTEENVKSIIKRILI